MMAPRQVERLARPLLLIIPSNQMKRHSDLAFAMSKHSDLRFTLRLFGDLPANLRQHFDLQFENTRLPVMYQNSSSNFVQIVAPWRPVCAMPPLANAPFLKFLNEEVMTAITTIEWFRECQIVALACEDLCLDAARISMEERIQAQQTT